MEVIICGGANIGKSFSESRPPSQLTATGRAREYMRAKSFSMKTKNAAQSSFIITASPDHRANTRSVGR
jgi:hypothetical protein